MGETGVRQLILGGARSGKTRLALERARAESAKSLRPVIYVATAEALDGEMQDRIEQHRAERPADWRTVEAPRHLAEQLQCLPADSIVVIDCLTLWLSNALLADFDAANHRATLPTLTRERDALLQYLAKCNTALIMVSNEVGLGIVPASSLARRFADEQGRLNQAVAAMCERVTWVAAGLGLELKPA